MSNCKQNAVSDRSLTKLWTKETPMLWSERQNAVMAESWRGEEKQRVRLICLGRKRPNLGFRHLQINEDSCCLPIYWWY